MTHKRQVLRRQKCVDLQLSVCTLKVTFFYLICKLLGTRKKKDPTINGELDSLRFLDRNPTGGLWDPAMTVHL